MGAKGDIIKEVQQLFLYSCPEFEVESQTIAER
jgi:hypothetical protein